MAALIISATICDHLGGFRFLLAISYNSALSMALSNSIFSDSSQVTNCLLVQLRVGCSSHCAQKLSSFSGRDLLADWTPPRLRASAQQVCERKEDSAQSKYRKITPFHHHRYWNSSLRSANKCSPSRLRLSSRFRRNEWVRTDSQLDSQLTDRA